MFYATQRLGPRFAGRHSKIIESLLDTLIDAKGLSTSHDRLSGTYHQMDDNRYRAVIRNLIQSNAICHRALQAGENFWEGAFKALNGSPT